MKIAATITLICSTLFTLCLIFAPWRVDENGRYKGQDRSYIESAPIWSPPSASQGEHISFETSIFWVRIFLVLVIWGFLSHIAKMIALREVRDSQRATKESADKLAQLESLRIEKAEQMLQEAQRIRIEAEGTRKAKEKMAAEDGEKRYQPPPDYQPKSIK